MITVALPSTSGGVIAYSAATATSGKRYHIVHEEAMEGRDRVREYPQLLNEPSPVEGFRGSSEGGEGVGEAGERIERIENKKILRGKSGFKST